MPKKSSSKIVWISISLLIAVGIIACVALHFFFRPYMAVYLTTGDIYFGKTSTFPCVEVEDAWFLQRAQDGNLGLQRFAEAVWEPAGDIKINKDQIVFIAKLSDTSPIIQAIEGKVFPQQQVQQSGTNTEQENVIDSGVINVE
ncbi:MAG: hypothetical protein PHS16_02825 [Candidatus Colwellbacteria bacterium]|jgi:hypothetical protein|nr:hypothetical protein [Candidatus Colwellbacteria bacterium]MCK9497571.1 hypothetical protein [Candidatus Colwellbacteria bacterium]MDD3752837.1 hypothetical protein [Candidatus Colwellbacteria bacterium]MDD4818877.1 hypothetical protein [Candidatus Colwellbacteria bacterium]